MTPISSKPWPCSKPRALKEGDLYLGPGLGTSASARVRVWLLLGEH